MTDMSLNMFCKGQKINTEEFRDHWEETFGKKKYDEEKKEDTKEEDEAKKNL